jgi:predicted Zn-dependent peptidase
MYQRFVQENGLRVFINELPHTRSVTLAIYVGIGARYEDEPLGGISHFIEHMLFKGTEKRPTAQEIAVAIEGIGGAFNASTGHELTNYWVKVAYQHFDTALDVLSDMLKRSRFEAQEIEKERRVIIEEINQTFDTPDELVFYDLDQLMWPQHPLGRDIAGTPQSVSSLTRAQMADYVARHYCGSNIVVSAAGFIETQPALEKIAAALAEFQPAPHGEYVRFQNGQHAPRWHVRNKKTEQAHVVVTTWAYPRMHPDRFVVSTLSTILGEGMSSRLFEEIREKRGLAYAVSSFASSLDDCGYFGSYAAVEPKKAAATLEAILREWARLRDEIVPAEELTKAKELMKGQLLLGMEDTHSIAAWYGRQEVLGNEILTVDDVTAGIDAVTAEAVQRVARDLFRNEWLNLAVLGPFRSDGNFARALKL